jgi:hypothetical protein
VLVDEVWGSWAIWLVIKFIRVPFCVPMDDVLFGQVGRDVEGQEGYFYLSPFLGAW